MKKITCIILLIIFSFTLTNAYAAKEYGKNEFKFELNHGNKSYTIVKYKPSRKSSPHVIIPSEYNDLPVTMIGREVFYECKKIESVIIPEGITNVGAHAFYDCENLKSIQFPTSLTDIGQHAFEHCNSLETVYIPNNVEIYYQAFFECANLKSIEISVEAEDCADGVTSIENEAFRKCPNLETVTLGKYVAEIGYGAFSTCTNLKVVNFDGTISEWNAIEKKDNIFAGSTNLKHINCDGTIIEWNAVK